MPAVFSLVYVPRTLIVRGDPTATSQKILTSEMLFRLTYLLLPAFAPAVNRWAIIPETGELWILLWLLIKRIRTQPVPAAVS